MKREEILNTPLFKSATCMDLFNFVYEICCFNTDDDKQIDVKVTKTQNKHRHGKQSKMSY